MKNVWISIVTFIMGSGVGFLIAKRVYREKYAALAAEEIASVKEVFSRRAERTSILPSEIEKKIINSEEFDRAFKNHQKRMINPIAGLTRSSLDGTNTNRYDQAKKQYNITKAKEIQEELDAQEEPEGDPDDDDEDTDDAGGTEEDSIDKAPVDIPPYSIEEEEFHSGAQHHDKLSLYYYTEDEVLCDENDEIVSDVDGVVGDENLLAFGSQNKLWVRNDGLGIDWEIIAIHKSYDQEVLGERG